MDGRGALTLRVCLCPHQTRLPLSMANTAHTSPLTNTDRTSPMTSTSSPFAPDQTQQCEYEQCNDYGCGE
ncbi:MAG: hypothetical protein GY938_27410 [Ketobacter sp.]|nr:hypothetical protein [Ketobacter sp.]